MQSLNLKSATSAKLSITNFGVLFANTQQKNGDLVTMGNVELLVIWICSSPNYLARIVNTVMMSPIVLIAAATIVYLRASENSPLILGFYQAAAL